MPIDHDQLMLDVDMAQDENIHPKTATTQRMARPTTAAVFSEGLNPSNLDIVRKGKRACQGEGPRNGVSRRLGTNLLNSNTSGMMSSSSLSTNITMNSTVDSTMIQREIGI